MHASFQHLDWLIHASFEPLDWVSVHAFPKHFPRHKYWPVLPCLLVPRHLKMAVYCRCPNFPKPDFNLARNKLYLAGIYEMEK